jgi:hypothetical protein
LHHIDGEAPWLLQLETLLFAATITLKLLNIKLGLLLRDPSGRPTTQFINISLSAYYIRFINNKSANKQRELINEGWRDDY